MDGYALARALRNLPGFQQSTFVAITGYASDKDRGAALRAGFDAHVPKPADVGKLERFIVKAQADKVHALSQFDRTRNASPMLRVTSTSITTAAAISSGEHFWADILGWCRRPISGRGQETWTGPGGYIGRRKSESECCDHRSNCYSACSCVQRIQASQSRVPPSRGSHHDERLMQSLPRSAEEVCWPERNPNISPCSRADWPRRRERQLPATWESATELANARLRLAPSSAVNRASSVRWLRQACPSSPYSFSAAHCLTTFP
jgi:CheY-like chemotaxis protein